MNYLISLVPAISAIIVAVIYNFSSPRKLDIDVLLEQLNVLYAPLHRAIFLDNDLNKVVEITFHNYAMAPSRLLHYCHQIQSGALSEKQEDRLRDYILREFQSLQYKVGYSDYSPSKSLLLGACLTAYIVFATFDLENGEIVFRTFGTGLHGIIVMFVWMIPMYAIFYLLQCIKR